MKQRIPKHRIFVYGTLLRGEANYPILAKSKFIYAGTTPGTLYGFGFAPGAVDRVHPGHQGGLIHGEIFEVDKDVLRHLDYIEGEPVNYRRTPINVCAEDLSVPGNKIYVMSEIYWYQHPVDRGELIVSGDWRDYYGSRAYRSRVNAAV